MRIPTNASERPSAIEAAVTPAVPVRILASRGDCDGLLAEDAARALWQAGPFEWRELQIEVADARVTLTGRVCTYYPKQLAQSVVMSLVGVRSVENQIVVK